ncbi:hypothetical protein MJO47_05185 [Desulfuromonas sp. KJ2020]|uniref:hypothetical protein n=1 Tax=Desulfuromonas sp. KJ2020 TaxID=2919173 RepID=UPI0020A8031E|nr:hypothetical protein [Desulfuromonas sp. KJ2020]MCP3176489.1 hypothetical protein [Desulfuromonas sp. KJ2020]
MMGFQTRWIFLIGAALLLSGCGSVRYTSSLKYSGDPAQTIEDSRFRIVALSMPYDTSDAGVSYRLKPLAETGPFAERAIQLYPAIFSNDTSALPIKVTVNADPEIGVKGSVLTALTLGLIPFPNHDRMDFAVTVQGDGDKALHPTAIPVQREDVYWMSLIGPLGAIPIGGPSDLPRDGIFLFIPLSKDAYNTSKPVEFSRDSLIEATVQALRQADPARLRGAYRDRDASTQQEIYIEGKPHWLVLAPYVPEGMTTQWAASAYSVRVYDEKAREKSAPLQEIIVARRNERGGWQPDSGYLHSARELTAVSALLEDGRPGRILVRPVSEPPLEDFIEPAEMNAAHLRWSNGILLEAKNRSLPRMLQEKPREDLLALVTRIEKAALELNEQAERAKDRAQAMVEKGEGDPAPDRELAILCRQRLDVLRPILAALQQEIVRRGR